MKAFFALFLTLGLSVTLTAETINLGGGRTARLTLPETWKATEVFPGLSGSPANGTTVRYVTKNGSNDAVLISLLSVPDERLAEPAVLRELVEASSQQFVDSSVERKAYLKEFKVDGKTGYACLFTDDTLVDLPTKKDDYKTLTSCYVYLGNHLLLAAMIFSDDPAAPAFAEARRLVQSLTLSSPQQTF